MEIRGLLRRMPGGWGLDAVLLIAFVALTAALAARTPLVQWDVTIADWCDSHRPDVANAIAGVLNYVGQGSPLAVLALGIAAWRARQRQSVRPVLLVVATYVLINLVVAPPKVLSGRPGPHAKIAHPEWLLGMGSGMSYPSGHVVNAVVWYAVIALLLGTALPRPARLVVLLLPTPLVIATTTYLGYHWFTDDVAAVLLGVVIARMVYRVQWDEIPLGTRLATSGWDRAAGLGQQPVRQMEGS